METKQSIIAILSSSKRITRRCRDYVDILTQAGTLPRHTFNLESQPVDGIVEELGLKYDIADIVFDIDAISKHRAKLFAVLDKITQKGRPVLNSVQALCGDGTDNGFCREFLEFCKRHNIPMSIMCPTALENLTAKSKLLSLAQKGPYSVVNMIINRESIPEVEFFKSSRTFIPTNLPEVLYRHKIVDERYWYWDEKGAALWLYLKESANYPFFKETYDVLQTNITKIRNRVFSIAGTNTNGLETVDVIALGVGSAEKELLILKEMLDYYRTVGTGLKSPMYYIPMDISFPLLQNTIRLLFSDSTLRGHTEQGNLLLRPILTDFLQIPSYLTETPNKNKLIIALGVLVNVSESDAFEAWKKIMDDDALLLIDAELVGERTDEELCTEYQCEENYNLVYHPVDMLCKSTGKDETFTVPVRGGHKSIHYGYFEPYSRNGENFVVAVVEKDCLEMLSEKYRIPEEDVKAYMSLSNVEGAKTVVTLLVPQNKTLSSLILGYSTKYRYSELKEFITQSGFEIVEEYLDKDRTPIKSRFGYFLLRKI